jgi:hypothetical protein
LKSRKRLKNTQRRNEPEFFLDRNLGREKLASLLHPTFKIVTHRSCFGERQNVSDPEIIEFCGKKHLVLISADYDFQSMYAKEIRAAKIAAFVVSNNHEGPNKWGPRIVSAKDEILFHLKNRNKPFVGLISETGRVSKLWLYKRNATIEIPLAKYTGPQSPRPKRRRRRR